MTVAATSSTPGDHVTPAGDLTSSLGASSAASATLTVTETAFTVPAAIGGGTITGGISSTIAGCEIANATAATPEAVAGSGPAGVDFPHGLIGLQIEGCSPAIDVTITVTFPSALAPVPAMPPWLIGLLGLGLVTLLAITASSRRHV